MHIYGHASGHGPQLRLHMTRGKRRILHTFLVSLPNKDDQYLMISLLSPPSKAHGLATSLRKPEIPVAGTEDNDEDELSTMHDHEQQVNYKVFIIDENDPLTYTSTVALSITSSPLPQVRKKQKKPPSSSSRRRHHQEPIRGIRILRKKIKGHRPWRRPRQLGQLRKSRR